MVRDLLVYHGIPYTVDDAILMLLMINDGIIDLVLLIKVKASMNIKESMLLSPNKHGQVQVYQPCSALSRLLEIDSLRRYFLPLLAYADIFRLCRTSTEIRSMISEDDILIHELFSLQLSFSLRQVDRAEMRFGWREAAALAARLSPWPTDFLLDLEQRNRAQYWLNVYKHSMLNKRAVVFEGKEQGKNRAVVANEHFPVTQSSSNEFMTDNALTLRPLSATPFTKIMSTGTTGRLVPVSSYVAYFEISIHALDASAPLQVSHTAQYERNDLFLEDIKPCVSIGISRHGFNLYRFLPGWDPHSFGFHGDDGLFYCGDSTEGVHIANANECMYGEGDTVGFGIVYPTKHGVFSEEDQHAHGGFFFTKNGKLHAYLCNTYRHFFQHAWFPTIGTDSFNPITFNFGTNAIEPFIFDVDEFERGSAPFQSMVAPHLNVHGDTCFFKAMTQIRHLHASKVAADIPLNPLMRYYAFDDAYKNPRKKYLSHGESPSGAASEQQTLFLLKPFRLLVIQQTSTEYLEYGDDEDEDDDLYDDQILDDGTSGYFRFVMDSEGNPQLVPDEVSDYSEDDDEEEESMEEEDDEEEDEEEGDGASGSPQAQPINLSSSSNSFMSGHNQEMEQLFNRLRERNIPVDRYLRQAERLLRRYGGIRDEVADEEEEGEEAEETEQVETTGAESHDQSIANGTVSPPRSENAEDEGDEIGFTDFAGDIC